MEGRKLEVLAKGQQVVAFGVHPETSRDYHWPLGETPLEVAFDRLPLVDEAGCRSLCGEASHLLGEAQRRRRPGRSGGTGGGGGVVRDDKGWVTDGRDAWLSTIAFHTVHDALERGDTLDQAALAAIAWERFADSSDLTRPHGSAGYCPDDAARKVADKLRLLEEGRLPSRGAGAIEAAYRPPLQDVERARAALDAALVDACRRIAAWHTVPSGYAPQIGLRATVGLGKSRLAQTHLSALLRSLRDAGLPSRNPGAHAVARAC